MLLETRVRQLWARKNIATLFLMPLALLFRLFVFLRRSIYRSGLCRVYRAPIPVIVIGNITVGGSGKTPLLISLCQHLSLAGISVGIVSRGYGGTYQGTCLVEGHGDPVTFGDEAVLIAQKTACPVAVAHCRGKAIQLLLKAQANVEKPLQLILSDDGLQHYAMARDLEIVVVDAKSNFGNGYCLPAGPLREPLTRLQQADLIVSKGRSSVTELSYSIKLTCFRHLVSYNQSDILSWRGKKVHAVAGIGNPQSFFSALQACGVQVIPHAKPDHCQYEKNSLQFDENQAVIMTEKDAVKWQRYATENDYAAEIDLELSKALQLAFQQGLRQLGFKDFTWTKNS